MPSIAFAEFQLSRGAAVYFERLVRACVSTLTGPAGRTQDNWHY